MVTPRNKAREALDALKNEFPQCFTTGRNRPPLAYDIHQQIFRTDLPFSRNDLRKAISVYTKSKHYQKHLIAGTWRVDIDGNETTLVTPSEALHAKQTLAKQQKMERSFTVTTTNHYTGLRQNSLFAPTRSNANSVALNQPTPSKRSFSV